MRLSRRHERKRARIEMVPLIDIVFLLLVFFIHAMLSMVTHRGLAVELPSAATSLADRRDFVAVTVTRDNRLYVDKEEATLENLAARVLERMAENPDMPVFVSGDRRADLGIAIEVLDELRAAGVREVSVECAEKTE